MTSLSIGPTASNTVPVVLEASHSPEAKKTIALTSLPIGGVFMGLNSEPDAIFQRIEAPPNKEQEVDKMGTPISEHDRNTVFYHELMKLDDGSYAEDINTLHASANADLVKVSQITLPVVENIAEKTSSTISDIVA